MSHDSPHRIIHAVRVANVDLSGVPCEYVIDRSGDNDVWSICFHKDESDEVAVALPEDGVVHLTSDAAVASELSSALDREDL